MNDMAVLEGARSIFFAESHELLDAMEQDLQALHEAPGDTERINALFRAAHTIKGSSGMFGLAPVVEFTHGLETALARVRDGLAELTHDLADRLLECRDHLIDLIEHEELQPETAAEALQARSAELTALLQGAAAMPAPAAQPQASATAAASATSPSPSMSNVQRMHDSWHISLRFARNVLRDGMDPASFIRYLNSLGKIIHVTTLADSLPTADRMDPFDCHLGFEIDLKTDADKQAIESAFEFVRNDCQLHILPPESRTQDYIDLIRQLPESPQHLGEILIAAGILTPAELAQALGQQVGSSGGTTAPLGEVLVQEKVVPQAVVDAAVAKQSTARQSAEEQYLRVSARKLDALIDLVSELVIAGANTALVAKTERSAAMQEATGTLSALVADIRDSALQLRMVQIGETFNRFHRVVRDLSRDLGKELALDIRGGETELDKSVVEKIGDPLMHLVRNAIDHGIEPADVRAAAGKPSCGHIGLNAYHESGNIVIEVSDDGGGLHHDKILAKAREKGLVQLGEQLSEHDVVNLIFAPGFSTAEKVTNLSGRGVGMDVVSKNIQALRGTIEVNTEPGKGSRFALRLPLTLAIIDGFQVSVNDASYVIPLEMVVECLELAHGTPQGRNYLDLRGEVLPFVRLRELFHLPGPQPKRESIVVVRDGKRRSGLVVDQLHGELQAVIKPLSTVFRQVRGISGSTILGSGDVALILDVPSLADIASQGRAGRRSVDANELAKERDAS